MRGTTAKRLRHLSKLAAAKLAIEKQRPDLIVPYYLGLYKTSKRTWALRSKPKSMDSVPVAKSSSRKLARQSRNSLA